MASPMPVLRTACPEPRDRSSLTVRPLGNIRSGSHLPCVGGHSRPPSTNLRFSRSAWVDCQSSFQRSPRIHRLVAEFDELVAMRDRLEVSLAAADETRCRLLEMLIGETLVADKDRELEEAE
jgi:hypothetical protein